MNNEPEGRYQKEDTTSSIVESPVPGALPDVVPVQGRNPPTQPSEMH